MRSIQRKRWECRLSDKSVTTLREKPMYLRNIRTRAFVVAALFCIVSSLCSILPAQDRNPLHVEDVLRLRSFAPGSSVEVSPDGNSLAYVVDGPRIAESNDRSTQDIWILNVDNGETRNLTNGQGEKTRHQNGHLMDVSLHFYRMARGTVRHGFASGM